MSFLRALAKAAPICFAELANAETTNYGSFVHSSDLPSVLFLTGEIEPNDSFELRRAMREQEVDLVVPASPGGDLYEGLQIAAILHDKGIGTYLPAGASCESSCANIFLAGVSRLVVGELGVHQFYAGGDAAASNAPQDVTTAVVQYTTADIIGIMNQFETPPFVYEKMFGTTNIYYFSASEKPRLNRGIEDEIYLSIISEVDDFLKLSPQILQRPQSSSDLPVLSASTDEEKETVQDQPGGMEEIALALLASVNADWSLPNDPALTAIERYYAAYVDFYGNVLPRSAVMSDKQKFADRWPIRQYRVDPNSIEIGCNDDGCVIESIIEWSAKSVKRGAQASGASTWSLVLIRENGALKIAKEMGRTLRRD